MKRLFSLFLCLPTLFTCSSFGGKITLQSDALQLSLNAQGQVVALRDPAAGINYLAKNHPAPLLSVRVHGQVLQPDRVRRHKDQLILDFEKVTTIFIRTIEHDRYITFAVDSATNAEQIELVIWGPYPTTLGEVVGETVGVVQGKEYALAIQALNPKTIGGYPWNDNDCMPQIDIFDQKDLSDMKEDGKRYVLYRVEAAKPDSFGSTLQAYCRNRNSERMIQNLDHEQYLASAYADGGIIGSRIALFGCTVKDVLPTLAAIEINENLPHPQIDGQWGKTAPTASAAYLIMEFGEQNIEQALAITKKAGLRYLYHPEPFETWGHFVLRKNMFPNGVAGLRRCVQAAEQAGIMLGVHTLSNFITPNDSYVTPVPDKRLAKIGATQLENDIDAQQTDIPVHSPELFKPSKGDNLKTVVIDDELVQYARVSEQAPWTLLQCKRGAFATRPGAHLKAAAVAKLADHGYKVFLSNAELSIEMAERIADLFNATGLRQISFDGLEGNRSTAMGNYGEILFTTAWYDRLDAKIRQHYIADASRTTHYFWHIYTRMNWGEPWYAGFRESQTEYRLRNQPYFKRNLMPAMLGWFQMKPETSLEDMEWMLARSAGFHAGFGLVVHEAALQQNGEAEQILQSIAQWEKARMALAFSEEQKSRMQNVKNEFHLQAVNDHEWRLTPIHSYKLQHENVRQPGEPRQSTLTFVASSHHQQVEFLLTADGSGAENIGLEIDGSPRTRLPVTLRDGQVLRYRGGNKAMLLSKNWEKLQDVSVNPDLFSLAQGEHTVSISCAFKNTDAGRVKLELRVLDNSEKAARGL